MVRASRATTKPPRCKAKQVKLAAHVVKGIITMHLKGNSAYAIATHYESRGAKRSTVRDIITRYKDSGNTSHLVKQLLRRAVRESVRRLREFEENQAAYRFRVIKFKEINDYIRKHFKTWNLTAADLPGRTLLMALIQEIKPAHRRRPQKGIRWACGERAIYKKMKN
jgi:hypothetical protein